MLALNFITPFSIYCTGVQCTGKEDSGGCVYQNREESRWLCWMSSVVMVATVEKNTREKKPSHCRGSKVPGKILHYVTDRRLRILV
jgi:hypothetical protein